jgi:hypothetical protein
VMPAMHRSAGAAQAGASTGATNSRGTVIAASRPIIDLAGALLRYLSRAVPLQPPLAYYFTLLSVGPLLGSFITEPAMGTANIALRTT